jgi:hypothetical protein
LSNYEQPERRPEGNEGPEDVRKERVKDPTAVPDVPIDDETAGRHDNGVPDEQAGPGDDDGLPENTRRRVPS